MAADACACDCGGGECGHCACAAAADDEKRAPPHAWRHWARRCAAAPRRCAAALSARLGAHVPSALVAMLCIALLCRALSSAGDDASDFVELWQQHHPPCTATLVIRRELLPGSPAPRVTVNGASPGPVLRCPLGRSVRYTVVNQLPDDATTVHWHGLGQRGTPWADGVVGVSQCPIPNVPSKNTLVYEFTPERAGTFWYHGHFHEQYPDGLYGALIISSPEDDAAAAAGAAAATLLVPPPLDVDEWVWVLADAYDVPVTSLLGAYLSPASGGVEPTPDVITVNGVRPGGGFRVAAARAGPPVRLRLINAGTVSMFTFRMDGLPLMLVELDGVAVQPLPLRSLTLNVAQRASVILDWSRLHADVAASPGLWARVEAAREMYGAYDAEAPDGGLRGTAGGAPLDTRWAGLIAFADGAPSYVTPPALPAQHAGEREGDANLLEAAPLHAAAAPPPTHALALDVVFANDAAGVNRAYVNGVSTAGPSAAQLGRPALHAAALDGVRKEEADAAVGARGGVVRVRGDAATPFAVPRGAVVDVLLNNTDDGEHPFHLHGHAVWVVATSEQPQAEAEYAERGYVRRDVVSVPASGWARLRFVADNPGTWLLHCHIDFHVRAGLITTVLEAPEALRGMRLPAAHTANCANYRESIAAAE